jgi:hypothetical protein
MPASIRQVNQPYANADHQSLEYRACLFCVQYQWLDLVSVAICVGRSTTFSLGLDRITHHEGI